MHVLSRPAINDAISQHPDAAGWLNQWWKRAGSAHWEHLLAVRVDYQSVDQVGRCLIFNVRGNKYRLVVGVQYANPWTQGSLFVKHFLTHTQYDHGAWKKDCQE